jgi:tRNA (mo5U34)-methyltransferase
MMDEDIGSQDSMSRCIRTLPSPYPKRRLRAALSKWTDWFYEFSFQEGVSTQTDPLVNKIHRTRAEMIFPFLDDLFRDRWPEIRCLDLASHQGWFAMQIAVRGAGEVRGIDIRESHVERASFIGEITGLQNIRFEKRNLYEVDAGQDGVFDLTLFLGILYHLDNPLEALRTVRSVTKHLCVLETQVARPGPLLSCLWGSSPGLREGPAMAVIPSDEGHVEGERSVVLVPTLDALYQLLYAVGFDRLYLSVPPKSAYEQYANLDRVVVFASVA